MHCMNIKAFKGLQYVLCFVKGEGMFTRLCKGGLNEVHPDGIIGCITVSDQLRTCFPKMKSNHTNHFCCIFM